MKKINLKGINKNVWAIFVGVIVAVCSGAVGFYVNDYQLREKLAIEHVGIKPLNTEIIISPELRTLVSELDAMDEKGIYIYSIDSDRLKVFDDDEVKAYLENMMNRRKKYEKELKEQSSDLSLVTTLISQEKIDSKSFFKLASTHLKPDSSETKANLTKIQVAINDKIQKYENLLKKMDQLISQLISDVHAAKSNTLFQIDVILVNNGKTQALLRNSGEISFGEDVIYLKKKTKKYSRFSYGSDDVLDNFVLIKEKSFASMTLVVDEYNNRRRMLDLAKREYISGSRIATLKLYSSGGDITLTKEVLFRNDLEEERKVSLLDFIDEHYNTYITGAANNLIHTNRLRA